MQTTVVLEKRTRRYLNNLPFDQQNENV